MKHGDEDYLSMLPCYYKALEKQVKECAEDTILDPKNNGFVLYLKMVIS